MWNNIVGLGRPWMTLWRMRIACWITRATNKQTHTHTLRIRNTYSFFLATVVARTRLIITLYYFVVSCVVPVGSVSWMHYQEGQSSNLRLRRGVWQIAHIRNNPHFTCTGVYCALTVNNAFIGEVY